MAVNLLECLSILFALLFFCMVLPHRWFRDVFLSRAAMLVILGLGYMMYIALSIPYTTSDVYPADLVRLIPVFGLLILVLVSLCRRNFAGAKTDREPGGSCRHFLTYFFAGCLDFTGGCDRAKYSLGGYLCSE